MTTVVARDRASDHSETERPTNRPRDLAGAARPEPDARSFDPSRQPKADQVTPASRTGTGLPALAPRTAGPAVYRAPSIGARPRVGDFYEDHRY